MVPLLFPRQKASDFVNSLRGWIGYDASPQVPKRLLRFTSLSRRERCVQANPNLLLIVSTRGDWPIFGAGADRSLDL